MKFGNGNRNIWRGGVSKPQKTDLKWTETSEPLISPGNQVLMSRFKCYFSNWLFSEISNN